MKRLSALILTMAATAVSAAIYPSSDWFGTNVQKQTTAAGVRAALGITSVGGAATNVFFTTGQSTSPRVVSGSNTFDVVGTLTNATTGNAATATLATNLVAGANITNATISSIDNGILWTNYADAVGAQYDSEAAGLVFSTDLYSDNFHGGGSGLYGAASGITNLLASGTSVGWNKGTTGRATASFSNFNLDNAGLLYVGGLATDDSTSLTNVPTKWFSSIAEMTNVTGVANQVVYVDSYFGTNWWGGGKFKWENTSATIDNGWVFTSPVGGRWRRIDTGYATNVVFMEWFGVAENGAVDSYAAAQAAINATPNVGGHCITPPFSFGIGTTLLITNWRGCYFGSLDRTKPQGYRYWPNPVCTINWLGASGGTNIAAYNVGHTTFAKFGLDTRKGVNDGTQWSAAAGILFDVDMTATPQTTTSANMFDGLFFRERGTNSALVGLRIAYTGADNCEFFQLEDSYFQGGGGNIPNYWINTTNLGGAKAIQLGGGGGGNDSFGHMMKRCGFSTWQYFLYSSGGSWDINNNYGTAAGEAAYYIDGVKASYIRGCENEGDRRFLISPSVHGVTLENNRIAQSMSLAVSNIAEVDGINLTLRNNTWNTDASNLTPAVTNSFNSTGWYHGVHNKFPSTNDALLPSWRFLSSFKSFGDFGTITANNNIQSGPWKVPSATQETNVVYGKFTDGTAAGMEFTLMPSNGNFSVGSPLNNVAFAGYNSDLTKTSFQLGDAVLNNRVRVITASGGNLTQLQLKSHTGAYLELYSSNSAAKLNAGNAAATLNIPTNAFSLTMSNDLQVVRIEGDGRIKFGNNTNVEFVGPIYGNSLTATNVITLLTNDAAWANSPMRYGQIDLIDSNGVAYQRTATTSGTLAWNSTNLLGSGSGSSATYGFGTNTASASSWTNAANHVWSGVNTFSGSIIAGNWASAMNPGTFSLYNIRTDTGTAAGTYIEGSIGLNGTRALGIGGYINDTGSVSNMTVISYGGFVVKSNAFLTPPVLAEGDNWYFSSNGIPHVRYYLGGVATTVRLVP